MGKRPKYAEVADKEPNFRHVAFAEWLEVNTGAEIDSKSVQLAMSLVNVYRTTPEAQKVRERHSADVQAKRDATKTRVADKAKARAAKLREQLAEAEAKAAAVAPVKKAGKKAVSRPATKAAAAKAPYRRPKKAPVKKATSTTSNVSPIRDGIDDEPDEF